MTADLLLASLATGAVTFVATNIDDIVLLTVFFSQVAGGFRKRHIVAGQALGFSALVGVSLLGFWGGQVVPREWIGLLGLLPIALGVRKFLRRDDEQDEPHPVLLQGDARRFGGLLSRHTLAVAGVTVANGGDNIGIYTPLFASCGLPRLVVILAVFYLLLGAWCYAGYRLAGHPAVAKAFARHGRVVVPFVLVALGIFILVEAGSHLLLLSSWR